MSVRQVVQYELQMTGNLTTEAKKAGEAVDKLGKEGKEAAAKLKKETSETEKAFDSLGRGGQKALAMLGGPFADLGDLAFDLRESLVGATKVIGANGVAAAGAAVGVVALAFASKGLADAAIAARDRLVEQGLAARLPADAVQSLRDYERASQDAQNAIDVLTVKVGAPFADALAKAAYSGVGLIGLLERLTEKASPAATAVSKVGEALSWVSPVRWEMYLLEQGLGKLEETGKKAAETLGGGVLGSYLAKQGKKQIEDLPKTLRDRAKADADADAAAKEAAALQLARDAEIRGRMVGANQAGLDRAASGTASALVSGRLMSALQNLKPEWTKAMEHLGAAGVELEFLAEKEEAIANVRKHLAEAEAARLATEGAIRGAVGIGENLLGLSDDFPAAVRQLGAMIPGIPGAIVQGIGLVLDFDKLAQIEIKFLQGAVSYLKDLPEKFAKHLTENIPQLVGVVASLPGAIVEAAIMLPGAIIQALPEMVSRIASELTRAIDPTHGKIGELFRSQWDLKAAFDGDPNTRVRTVFPARHHTGTSYVPTDGTAFLARGERVISAEENARRARGNGGGWNVAGGIHLHGVNNVDELLRQIRERLGPYGTGESLDAYA